MAHNTLPPVPPVPPAPYGPGPAAFGGSTAYRQKSFVATWLLSLLLGGLGADRFYLGKVGTGLLKLATLGGFGIWALVDLILVLAGQQTDRNRQPLAGYSKHRLVALLVSIGVVVLGLVSGVGASAGGSSAARVASTPGSTTTAPASHATTPLATVPAAAAPAAAPTSPSTPTTKATTAAAKKTVLETKAFSGSGDDIVTVDLKGLPAIVTFECPACSSNTVLKSNGADSLLVNEIGAYSGTHIVDTKRTSATSEFEISAAGSWTLTISDVSTIQPSSGAVSGHGDTVVHLSGTTSKAAITNTGESNFVVIGYGSSFPQLAVNEIGSYSGTVRLTAPAFVQVESSGDWTITPQ